MTERPNILFIFCDQLRADALGGYGNTVVSTPNLDALAAGGTVFTSGYTPSPVCVPARASLITGAEPQTNDCYDNADPMPADAPTLMGALSSAGYRTHGIGKMHFQPDSQALMGFDSRERGEEFGTIDTDDYLRFVADQGYGAVEKPLGLRSEMYYVPQLAPVPEQAHHSHWVAERTTAFLADIDEPFFCWSSFIAPHPPFTPPSPWHRLYRPGLIPDPHIPERSAELLTLHNTFQNRYKFTDGGTDTNLRSLRRAYYYASVSYIDHQIGRILAALDARGLRESTTIVVSADHGEFLGDYGCYGKRSFLDAAARVPFIINGPGWQAQRRTEPVSLIDLFPTMAAIAGAHSDCEGVDLAQPLTREAIYGQFQHDHLGLYAVITDDFKYIYSAADAREYLIDRVRDPRETANLAHNPYHRATLARLRALATGHFRDLAGADLAGLTGNAPIPLGSDPQRQPLELFEQLDRTRDAGVLVLGDSADGPAPWQQYRTRTQPPDAGLAPSS